MFLTTSLLLSQAKPLPTVDTTDFDNLPAGAQQGLIDLNAIPVLFTNILNIVVALIGLASFVMLISGGVKFLTAGGDQKHIEQAKGTITWAIFGLVLTIASFLIMMYIGQFLGVKNNILQFRWPS